MEANRGSTYDLSPDEARVYIAHLERQQKTIASRLGAGWDTARALDPRRWERELADDAPTLGAAAADLTTDLMARIAAAIVGQADGRARASAALLVYAHQAETVRVGPQLAPIGSEGNGEHMLYILRDKGGHLLYIGITDRGPVRLAEHYRHKPWFGDVAQVEFERYASRADSEAREKYLIQRLAPRYNIQHNLGRHIA